MTGRVRLRYNTPARPIAPCNAAPVPAPIESNSRPARGNGWGYAIAAHNGCGLTALVSVEGRSRDSS